MSLVNELLVGLAAGAHISTWGMYKDSIHEGFTVPRYLRSTFVGLVWAPIIARLADLDATTAGGMALLFGVTYAAERATTEFWKTFIRDEDQSKYFIPMQFHVFGHVPRNRLTRLMVGLGYVGVACVAVWAATQLQPPPGTEGPLWQVLLVASIGGWYSACGGAFKDAPIEGFEWFKFFRSPVSAALRRRREAGSPPSGGQRPDLPRRLATASLASQLTRQLSAHRPSRDRVSRSPPSRATRPSSSPRSRAGSSPESRSPTPRCSPRDRSSSLSTWRSGLAS